MSEEKHEIKLAVKVLIAEEIDGIEMGVLEDGTPYLTGRSLARLCGVSHTAINDRTANWEDGKRDGKFAKLLIEQGFKDPLLYVPTQHGGRSIHAYADDVCMTFLEYYAFEAPAGQATEYAKQSYRMLARHSLREFIYKRLHYEPGKFVPEIWRQFHDRMKLNQAPLGYFNVFREISDICIAAAEHGLRLDAHTIPDISVGRIWSDHWSNNGLFRLYGERSQHPLNYPGYFPQACKNPHDVYIYPVEALGAFRHWLHRTYLQDKYPTYLKNKVKDGKITAQNMELILGAVTLAKRVKA